MCKKMIIALFIVLVFPLTVSAAEKHTTHVGVLRVVMDDNVIATVKNPVSISEMPLVPLRAIGEHIGGEVRWNAVSKKAELSYNGRQYPIGGVVHNASLMVSPEQIAHIFRMQMRYEPAISTMVFGYGPLPEESCLLTMLPRFEEYDPDDVHWLSRIVEAEARGECYESRLAVANVVLNRLAAPQYPDTVKDVIFDRKHGVQFTPTVNGAIKREATTLSYLAALDALDGHNNAPGALFFLSPKLATNFWVQKNRQFAFTIGGHAYYY